MNAKTMLIALLACAGLATLASASIDYASNTVGISGYDLVSYHNSKRPLRGNGHFVAVHAGVTYLFANEQNQATFERNPERYLPAYGGYCAFGVSVGKKFVADPEVWRVVDGKLYVNLDERIQDQWLMDVTGRIKTADDNWGGIKGKSPTEL